MVTFLHLNKKGDIPTAMLFLVAIALIIVSWVAFISSDTNIGEDSLEKSGLMSEIEFNKVYIIELSKLIANEAIASSNNADLKDKHKELAVKYDYNLTNTGNFFGKIRNNEFVFEKKENSYYFEAKNITVQAKNGENKIIRNFKLNFSIKNSP